MKLIGATLGLLLILVGCGGSSTEEEAGNKKYFIKVGDKISETAKSKGVNYTGDGISNEAIFSIGATKLYLYDFYNVSKLSPVKLESQSFGAIIEFDESIEGTATINKVTSTGTNQIGENFDLVGDFAGNNGESGSFCVSMFHM
ncbi:MAG: hypothetical protein ABJG68_13335 [Crocinitomicaceae bacterium]